MLVYEPVVLAHSYGRWLVLAGLLGLLWRSHRATTWSDLDERWHLATLVALDCQVTLGIWLYGWLSPLPSAFWANWRFGMKDSNLRFFGAIKGRAVGY